MDGLKTGSSPRGAFNYIATVKRGEQRIICLLYTSYRYADKIQKDPTKSLVYSQREEDLKHFNVTDNDDAPSVLSKKQKHVLYLFIATFVIMVASFIPWTDPVSYTHLDVYKRQMLPILFLILII